ncbi:hypothetical protein [Helicobacter pylori]|uniref:hypothetical protein n=1 Tax=Helicobacter pylori TaxID=210 RepID=UPI001556B7C9|nr:hypothetical protein [Helicobacter pylori]
MPETLPVDPVGLRTNSYMLTKAVRPLVGSRTSSLCHKNGVPFKTECYGSFRMRYLST